MTQRNRDTKNYIENDKVKVKTMKKRQKNKITNLIWTVYFSTSGPNALNIELIEFIDIFKAM